MAEPLTVGAVITLALTSSVVGAGITHAVTWFREATGSRKDAAYLALRLATTFERYAEDAAAALSDMDDCDNSGGAHGSYPDHVPKLAELPDEKERWRDIPVSLTARVLGFEPMRRVTQSGIANCFDLIGEEAGFADVRAATGKLGRRALDLATDLRNEYRLPPLESEWDWVTYLRKH